MASYYDEHDCDDVQNLQNPHTDLIRFVRLLLANGELTELQNNMLFDQSVSESGLAPPASAEAVENLEKRCVARSDVSSDLKCPVCLVPYEFEECVIEMPCGHMFHGQCILPWLEKTNSCPNCRHELPTDNEEYEKRKKEKEEERAREKRVEEYHHSMFG